MTQQSNTTNWVIHETGSGQPQMIKLVQSAGKSIGGIMTSAIAGQPVKIFKSPVSGQETRQIFTTTGTSQVIRATSAQKVGTKTVHLPLGTPKTIRLTPAQMQNLKLLKTQKIQIPQGATVVPVIQQSAIQTTASLKNFNSPPILDHSGSARKRHDPLDTDFAPESKRNRKNEKVSKGLRHFSMKVCDKVRKKGTTSYNEVAEELVEEFTKSNMNNSVTDQYDQKNIRRRVYDALNVLMAMKIISKEKKEIKWIGLPTNSWQECIQLEREKQKRIQSTREKMKQLQELIMNLIAFKNLSQRNKEMEASQGPPPPNSYIQLPFIVVNTNKKTVIDCCISNDKMEYLFQFNDKFEINDDVDILKSIGMLMGLDKGECTEENIERVKSLVPKSLREYVLQLATGTADQSINEILESTGQGPSNTTGIHAEDVVETQLDEDNSRQSSSFDPLSPAVEFSDEEGDSDISSDGEIN